MYRMPIKSPLIPTPCHQDWNSMSLTEKGRHCAVCDKEVNDLTTKSTIEISTFLTENGANKICIRVRTEPPTSFVIPEKRWIRTAPKWQHFLLAIALAFFGGELSAQVKGKKVAKKNVVQTIPEPYTTAMGDYSPDDTLAQDNTQDSNYVHDFTEVQAEFPGGQQAMVTFIHANIQYPNDPQCIGGTVYIQFEIDQYGKIKNIVQVRGVKSAPALTKEAIRLISIMPDWTPAKNKGKAVRSRFTLPVRFELR